MKAPLKTLPQMMRDTAGCKLEIRRSDKGRIDLSFPASSETPVERWFGEEILSHAKGAVRLDRAKRGAMPLLFNHNMSDPIGMVDGARLEDGRMIVDAHLFDTVRAKEVASMLDGGLANVSIGYRIYTVEEDKKAAVFTARDWEPYETSIVTVPADPSVGLGRDVQQFEVRTINPAQPATREVKTMTPEELAAAAASAGNPTPAAAAAAASTRASGGDPAPAQVSAVQAERERRQAIIDTCKANKIDARVETRWISEGIPLTVVAREVLDVMEERGKQKPGGATELGLSASEARRYSFFRALRALRYGGGNPRVMQEAAFERECSETVAKQLGRGDVSGLLVPAEILTRPMSPEVMARAMATQPGSKGGYLVNVENMGFIDILRNRSVAMRMGARQLSGLQGNIMFPRQTGKASVTWQAGEGSSVTAGDQALGQLSMTPKTAICVTDVSEQLLRQSSISAEQFVMADLAAVVAIDGVDNAAINGTGGSQPIGIKNTAGITSAQDAASATYAKILAFIQAAGAVNAIRGNPGWVTNTAGAIKLMQVQRFTSTDTPVWEGNAFDGQLVKFNAMSSEQLASGNLIFGSWDELVIGDWGVLELSTDNGGTRFNSAQVGIRALWMVDVLLRYPQAFVVSTNLS